MLPPTEPRKAALYDQTIACFPLGLNHAGYRYEAVSIPWEGRQLAGWLFKPSKSEGALTPCVVFLSGADALPEQNFFRGVQWLTARGLACLLFNGPGQGGAIRLQGLTTVPDYERPVTAAVNYLLERGDIDGDRLGLMGVSMGGYYVMRAAAFEHRFRRVVVWGAMYSIYEDLWQHYPPLRPQLRWITGAKDDADAAARGVFERLFGLVAEVIEPETVKRGTEWIR